MMASTAAVLAAASYSNAQQFGLAGSEITIDFGAGVSVNDNAGLDDPSAGSTTDAYTSLGFGFSSETLNSKLTARFGGSLTYSDPPGQGGDVEFTSPGLSIDYTQTGANSSLAVGGRFSRTELDDALITVLDQNFQPVDLTVSGGDLERTVATASLSTGILGPLGFDVNLRYDNRDYVGTVNPNLYDRTTLNAGAAMRLIFSDVLTGRVTADWSHFDAEDAVSTERRSTSFGIGADYDVSPATRVSADVQIVDAETTEGGVVTDSADGFDWSISGVHQLQNGSVSAGARRTVSTAADRTQVDIDRNIELANGNLSFGLGYSFAERGDDVLLLRAAFSRDFPRGTLGASLSQTAVANDDDDDVLFTRLGVNYMADINNVSNVTVDFGLGRSEPIGVSGGSDTTRADFGVTYRRELTSEWNWALGYRARFKDDSGVTAMSNTIFTGIDRSFILRP